MLAVGKSLKDQYDALAPRMPPHLVALVEQIKNAKAELIGSLSVVATGDEWNRNNTGSFIPYRAAFVRTPDALLR
jgi:hypothetical protein